MRFSCFLRTFRSCLLMVIPVLFSACASQSQVTMMLPGDVPLELVRIPAGSFMVGSPEDEQDRNRIDKDNEGPQHKITLTHDFYMGKYEVTKAQWMAVMGNEPWTGKENVLYHANSPAHYVSWDDINGADGFMERLNEHLASTEQLPATFRLPSEAEWEYACRANTTTRFYWGDDPTYTEINAYAWYFNNTYDVNERYAHVVGLKQANAWGLYDMTGNVWEWCQDYYGSYDSASQIDPTGPSSGIGRVLRGGSWYYYSWGCRSAFRSNNYPDNRNYYNGFRVVRTQP